MARHESWILRNLANILSLSRIVFAPLVFYQVTNFEKRNAAAEWFTLVLTIILLITDALDGYYARRFAEPTVFGATIDPAADSLFFLTVMMGYINCGRYHVHTLVPTIVIWRETIMHLIRRWAAFNQVSMGAMLSGKLKTASQCVILCILFLGTALTDTFPDVFPELLMEKVTYHAWWLIAFLNVVSMPQYLLRMKSLHSEFKKKKD